MSLTFLCPFSVSIGPSKWRTPPLLRSERRRRAALVLSWNTKLVNEQQVCSVLNDGEVLEMHCCILPSLNSSFRSPSRQVSSCHSRHVMWSLAFDLRAGFWNRRIGMSVAAFRATDSRAELVAKALNRPASSETNDFPAFP